MMKYDGCAYTYPPLEGSLIERLKILDCHVPFGVTEPIPAPYGQRLGTPPFPNESLQGPV